MLRWLLVTLQRTAQALGKMVPGTFGGRSKTATPVVRPKAVRRRMVPMCRRICPVQVADASVYGGTSGDTYSGTSGIHALNGNFFFMVNGREIISRWLYPEFEFDSNEHYDPISNDPGASIDWMTNDGVSVFWTQSLSGTLHIQSKVIDTGPTEPATDLYTAPETGTTVLNALTWHATNNRLYWVQDEGTFSNETTSLRSMNVDGSDVQVHYTHTGDLGTSSVGFLYNGFTISVSPGYVWGFAYSSNTPAQEHGLFAYNIHTGVMTFDWHDATEGGALFWNMGPGLCDDTVVIMASPASGLGLQAWSPDFTHTAAWPGCSGAGPTDTYTYGNTADWSKIVYVDSSLDVWEGR